jgi:hypothetical protein
MWKPHLYRSMLSVTESIRLEMAVTTVAAALAWGTLAWANFGKSEFRPTIANYGFVMDLSLTSLGLSLLLRKWWVPRKSWEALLDEFPEAQREAIKGRFASMATVSLLCAGAYATFGWVISAQLRAGNDGFNTGWSEPAAAFCGLGSVAFLVASILSLDGRLRAGKEPEDPDSFDRVIVAIRQHRSDSAKVNEVAKVLGVQTDNA